MVSKSSKVIHGDDLLYRFFHELLTEQPELAPEILTKMYSTMGIWLPLNLYYEFPVLLPWVVRDHTCRGDKKKGIPDQWSSPDQDGYLRDDNSLVKSLARGFMIEGSGMVHLHGARLGTEFVASHVWRKVNHASLASRHPLLNSFVPNLVWLPSQVAKLTDREGEVMQRTLQALSWTIYRDAPVAPHLRRVVEDAWSLIPEPDMEVGSFGELNTFIVKDKFLTTRRDRLRSVINALDLLEKGMPLTKKVVTTRFTEGLPTVGAAQRSKLKSFLEQFDTPTEKFV